MYLFFLERYPHGIFAVGRAYVPTQEKKKKKKTRDKIIFSVPAIWSKSQVFEILDISLEIPSFLNSRCEKPSISKFLIRNT